LSVPLDQEREACRCLKQQREARRCLEQSEINQEPLLLLFEAPKRRSASRSCFEMPKRLLLLLTGARGLSEPLEQEARCLKQERDYGNKQERWLSSQPFHHDDDDHHHHHHGGASWLQLTSFKVIKLVSRSLI
jgi:hypothetical protein